MPAALIPAAIASVATQSIQGAQTKKNLARQQRYNKQLAEYTFDRNLDMWMRNNKYNSPAEQMRRLNEAGLNPNLAYGSGNVGGNTGGAIPKYQEDAPDFSQQKPMVNPASAVQGALMAAQIESIQATTDQIGLDNYGKRIELGLPNKGQATPEGIDPEYGATRSGNIKSDQVYNTALKVYHEAQLSKLKVDEQKFGNAVKAYAARLANKNINPSDSLLARIVASILKNSGIRLQDITLKSILQLLNKGK